MVRRVEIRRLRDCRNITHVDAIASPVKKKDGLIQPSRGLEGVEPPTKHLPLNVMSIYWWPSIPLLGLIMSLRKRRQKWNDNEKVSGK
jgi:hypothetical protein